MHNFTKMQLLFSDPLELLKIILKKYTEHT